MTDNEMKTSRLIAIIWQVLWRRMFFFRVLLVKAQKDVVLSISDKK